MENYILDGHTPIATAHWEEWARWMAIHKYGPRQRYRRALMSGAGEQFEMLVQRAPRPPVRGGRTPRPPLTGGYETETHREYRLRGADLTRVGERHFGSTIWVSTVFLGIDHRFGGEGPPLLFETMIFGGPHDQSQYRCSTWQEAEHMHADACALVLGRGPQACAIATDQLDD